MNIRIAGTVNDSIVDGPGFRYAIFTQGCLRNCPGCHNPQTQPLDGGHMDTTERIIEEFQKNTLLDGITLSGGEPFLQPEPCRMLANAAHEAGLSVWAYSGYTFEELCADPEKKRLLAVCDVLVDGAFVLKKRTLSKRFRGSSNQRVINVPETLKTGEIVLAEP